MSEKSDDHTPIVRVALRRPDVLEWIRSTPTLAECQLVKALGSTLPQVVKASAAKRVPNGVLLHQQGDAGDSLLLILGGDVRLFGRRDRDNVELGPVLVGDFLGEQEVLQGSSHRALSAIARGSVELLDIPRSALLMSGKVRPQVKTLLESALAARNARLEELTDFVNRW